MFYKKEETQDQNPLVENDQGSRLYSSHDSIHGAVLDGPSDDTDGEEVSSGNTWLLN